MNPREMKEKQDEAFEVVKRLREILDAMSKDSDVDTVTLDEEKQEARFTFRHVAFTVKADAKENKQFDRYYPWIVAYRTDTPAERSEWQIVEYEKGPEIGVSEGSCPIKDEKLVRRFLGQKVIGGLWPDKLRRPF